MDPITALPAVTLPVSSASQADLGEQLHDQLVSDPDYQLVQTLLQDHTDTETATPRPMTQNEMAALLGVEPTETTGRAQVDLSIAITTARLQVELRTTSGERISANVSVTQVEASVTATTAQADPLALDLDGDGLQTDPTNAMLFDLNGDGTSERIGTLVGNDAYLALDRNGNGRIDDGSELFGDQHGAANGYAELARFDGNGDGLIDAQDGIYERLQLWRPDGTQSLAEAGIRSLSLAYRETPQRLSDTDRLAQSGSYTRNDGSVGMSGDLLLGFRA